MKEIEIEREKALINWRQLYPNGTAISWHYFKRAWGICVDNGRCHIHESGDINKYVLDSVIQALKYNPLIP